MKKKKLESAEWFKTEIAKHAKDPTNEVRKVMELNLEKTKMFISVIDENIELFLSDSPADPCILVVTPCPYAGQGTQARQTVCHLCITQGR